MKKNICFIIKVMMIFTGIILVGDSSRVFAQTSLQKEFEKSYDSSDYKNAIIFMQQKLAQKKNSTNYYNLGNAYYKNHELGKAFASYLKAQELAPLDSDIKANINFIKESLVDSLETEYVSSLDMFFFWNFFINKKTSVLIMFLLIAVFELCLFLYFVVSSFKKRMFKILSLVMFCLALLWSGSTAVKLKKLSFTAVISETALVRSTPNQDDSVLFSLHEGAPLMIKDDSYEGNWYKIKLSDGKEGWIQKDEVLVY